MHRKTLALIVASLVATLAVPTAAAQGQASIVTNGDFEQPQVSPLWANLRPPGFDGWTVDSGSVDLIHDLWSAASGIQSLDLTGFFDERGSISQILSTTPGATYTLSFAFAGNPDSNPICLASPVVKRMEVFWGGASLGVFEFDITGHTLADPGWQTISLPVVAATSTTTLRFTSLTLGACGPALDDVAVIPGPPPAQPQRPGKGCGDPNHVHEREFECTKPPR